MNGGGKRSSLLRYFHYYGRKKSFTISTGKGGRLCLTFLKKKKKLKLEKKTFFKTFDLIFFNELSYTFKGVYFLLNIDNCDVDFFIFRQYYHIIIVSRFPNETKHFSPQTFVKTLIIQNIHSHHIYMKQKEGASVQVSGETERESESESVWIAANWGNVYHKNGCWKNGPFWDKLG